MKRLDELSALDLSSVGSKAAYLAELRNSGFKIPNGFVLLAGERLPSEPQLNKYLDKLSTDFFAVRSSPAPHPPNNTECLAELQSRNWVRRRSVLKAIIACRESVKSKYTRYYMQRMALSDLPNAILVQEMVEVISSGVVFTHLPDSDDRMEIHACYGSGDFVSIGKTVPDTYIVDRKSKKLICEEINSQNIKSTRAGATQVSPQMAKKPKLSADQISQVLDLAEKIEGQFKQPQDIEFCFDSAGLWILQARPLLF